MGAGAQAQLDNAAAPPQQQGAEHGQDGRGVDQQQQDDHLTSVSKEMAQVLRHDPPSEIDGCGFVPMSQLISKLDQPTNEQEIKKIVRTDDKGRYQLADQGFGELHVRAVQGHSVPLENPLHNPIHAPEEVPLALHATSPENWEKIQASGELRRMHRTHIHFASEPKLLRGNDWACVLLEVDLRRAIEAGIGFCKAANGVVLSEGPIPVEFVKRRKLRDLPKEWQQEIPNRDRLLQEEAEH